VLTFLHARKISTSWSAAALVAAIALTIMAAGASRASADTSVSTESCTDTWTSYSCVTRWGPATDPFVRIVPQPRDDEERTRATERDRKWFDRCHPIIRADRYGVSRYHYAAAGCEFGVGRD
jgi:hypothetical protein